MRRLAFLLGLIFLINVAAAAQDAPRIEAFGGYSYFRLKPGPVASIPGQNFNGGTGSVAVNLVPALGFVADFGGYHAGNFNGVGSVNAFSYLFGPKVTIRTKKVDPFIQWLFGGTRASGTGIGSSQNTFAMDIGGGVDYKATSRVALRLVQADYVLTRFDVRLGTPTDQHNFRLSFGVVFRLGKM